MVTNWTVTAQDVPGLFLPLPISCTAAFQGFVTGVLFVTYDYTGQSQDVPRLLLIILPCHADFCCPVQGLVTTGVLCPVITGQSQDVP